MKMKKYIITCMITLYAAAGLKAQAGYATISGKLDFLKDGDTVELVLFKYGHFNYAEEFLRHFFTRVTDHSFSLKVPVENYPQYVDLYLSPALLEKNLFNLLVQSEDRVAIKEVNGSYQFTGPGSDKYNLKMQLQAIWNKWDCKINYSDPEGARRSFEYIDKSVLERLHYLDSLKTPVGRDAFILFRDDILSSDLSAGMLVRNDRGEQSAGFRKALSSYHKNTALSERLDRMTADSAYLIHTNSFCEGTINKYRIDSCFMQDKPFMISDCYHHLKRAFSGTLREALVTWLIFDRRNLGQDLSYCTDDALSYLKNKDFQSLLHNLKATRLRGARAFNFQLTDAAGRQRRFSEFKGKVVLLDFWFTGCSACKQMAPVLENIEKQFVNQGVVFASISVDKRKELWLNSVGQRLYTSRYSVDLFTGSRGIDDPAIRQYHITGFPTLILIDKDGRICETGGDPRSDNGNRLSFLIKQTLASENKKSK